MRFRSVLALMIAGVLMAAGVASAQDTTTEPLSDYTTTTPTVTTPPTTTTEEQPAQAPETAGEEAESGTAPSVASQPAGSAPSQLAFTGAEPLLLIAFGLALAGGTTFLLVRDRRRASGRR